MRASFLRSPYFGLSGEKARPWLAAMLTLLVGVLLTGMLVLAGDRFYRNLLQQRFNLLANERFNHAQERFDNQVRTLDSLARFVALSGDLAPEPFKQFVDPLLTDGLSYSWAPRLRDAQRAPFEAQMRGLGLADFAVQDLDKHGHLEVEGAQPEYFPLAFSRSLDAVGPTTGLDIYSNPLQREILLKAWQTQKVASLPILNHFGQDPDGIEGVFLMAPVFDRIAAQGAQANALPARAEALRGMVIAVIRARQLTAEGALAQGPPVLAVELDKTPGPDAPTVSLAASGTAVPDSLQASRLLTLADGHYVMTVRPTAQFMLSNQSPRPVLLIFGGLISLVFSLLTYILVTQRHRALALVELQTLELRLHGQELRTLSITDVLTGVYNRRYFQERLTSELLRIRRSHGQLALIMLDIDHFKRINDQFGHAVGDQVLQNMCQRLGERLRRTDVLCRLGGEEFIILCPDINADQALFLAQELRESLRGEIQGVGLVSASFGVAQWLPDESIDGLLSRVDAAVYAAKQAGRDRVERALA